MTGQKTLRIVQYLPAIRLEEGGVVRAVLDLCTVMSRRGTDVTLVTWDEKDAPEEWKKGGAGVPKIVKIEGPKIGPFLGKNSLKKIAGLMASCDVLHLHAPWILSNLQWARIARKHGVPYVVTAH